jgi:ferredoxin--NADP+ reductase
MPIVTTQGFRTAPDHTFNPADIDDARVARLAGTSDVDNLRSRLGELDLITIAFGNFADGRGFSLARRLRNAGYKGHLRASGHIIPDQFRYALDCGFDDVEISDEQAQRQSEADWTSGSTARLSYIARLRGLDHSTTANAAVTSDLNPGAPSTAGTYVSQANVFEQSVTNVEHFTDGLFSFRTTRPTSFRFRSGEFVMIGLPNAANPVFRAYSITSPSWDDDLEFYSIKVPGGPLTEHLQHLAVGDTVLVRKKATGTLVLDALTPARHLYLFATGTGIAPFASLIRDPETYEKFEQIVLTHSCRRHDELSYGHAAVRRAIEDPLVGDLAQRQLTFYPTTTREPGERTGRITAHIESGTLSRSLGLPPLDPAFDRAMICGSLPMVRDTKELLEAAGFEEGANNRPGDFVLERAFVD